VTRICELEIERIVITDPEINVASLPSLRELIVTGLQAALANINVGGARSGTMNGSLDLSNIIVDGDDTSEVIVEAVTQAVERTVTTKGDDRPSGVDHLTGGGV